MLCCVFRVVCHLGPQLRAGRAFLLLEKRTTLQSLLPFLASTNPIRQLGILKTVRRQSKISAPSKQHSIRRFDSH
jgi:hypothetical protein